MNIAIIGLGKMGSNIAIRLSRFHHHVVIYDNNPQAITDSFEKIEPGYGHKSDNFADLFRKLDSLNKETKQPKIIWLMLPAGPITDKVLAQATHHLEGGDIIIDGGNTYYKDDVIRAKALQTQGLNFADVGTSGGIWGLQRGYCLMYGARPEVAKTIAPILASLSQADEHRDTKKPAPVSMPQYGYLHCGPPGSGHFVKMVHNGIEYGMMQAFAEGFDVLKRRGTHDKLKEDEKFDLNLDEIAEVWRHGSVVSSFLLDLIAHSLSSDPQLSDLSGHVTDSGEGRWTIEAAIEEDVPTPVITASLFARFRSRTENTFAEKMLSAMRRGFGGHIEQK